VVGKLVAERQVSKETIKTTLIRWWKILDPTSFKILGENLFLVEFTNEDDKKKGKLQIPPLNFHRFTQNHPDTKKLSLTPPPNLPFSLA
jgi:hypothetical protein